MTLEELAKQKIIECVKNLKAADIDYADFRTSIIYYVIAMNDLNALSDEDTFKIINYYSCGGHTTSVHIKDNVLPEWFVVEG